MPIPSSTAISDRTKDMDDSMCAELEDLHSSMVSPMRDQ
jgi:hypothetical protein